MLNAAYSSFICQKRFNLVNRKDKSYGRYVAKWLDQIALRKTK